jgi:cytoskeletal protein RodZ
MRKKENNVTAMPITENGEAKAQKPADTAGTSEAKPAENIADGKTGGTEAPKTEETEKAETPPENQTPAEADQSNVIQSVFVHQAASGPAAYTLEGCVTLLRENLSAPLHIGGGVRVRAESVIYCTYRVKDASGNVLISATASGSSVRLTNAQNVDSALADLTGKVMTNAAEQIASRLSGVAIQSSPSPAS